MYRWIANAIAAAHVVWLLLTLLGPGIAWWVSPVLLGVAAVSNAVVWAYRRVTHRENAGGLRDSTCLLFLWEHYFWKRGKCRVYPVSMSRRMFRWIGVTLSEEQTGGVIGFLSVLLFVLSLLQLR